MAIASSRLTSYEQDSIEKEAENREGSHKLKSGFAVENPVFLPRQNSNSNVRKANILYQIGTSRKQDVLELPNIKAQDVIDSVIDESNPRYDAICSEIENYLNIHAIDSRTGEYISPLELGFLREQDANELSWMVGELEDVMIEDEAIAAKKAKRENNPVYRKLRNFKEKTGSFLSRNPTLKKIAAVSAGAAMISGAAGALFSEDDDDDSDNSNIEDILTNADDDFQEHRSSGSDFTEIQITTDEANQNCPAIYGNKIVWVDDRTGNWDIYMYDLETGEEKQITSDERWRGDPDIYGDKIVWVDDRNGNSDIYMYDLETDEEKRITTDKSDQSYPAIYGNKIVWEDNRNGNKDIYMYDLETDEEKRITTDGTDKIWPTICGPAIYRNKIIWDDARNGNWDIYMYDLETGEEKQITTDEANQVRPAIYRNKIIWDDARNGNNDIYMYDLETGEEKQITTDGTDKIWPAIYGDKIVWIGIWWDIYMYDLETGEEKQITTDEADQMYPAIYGNKIVWQDDRNGNWDIYMAELTDSGENQPPTVDAILWRVAEFGAEEFFLNDGDEINLEKGEQFYIYGSARDDTAVEKVEYRVNKESWKVIDYDYQWETAFLWTELPEGENLFEVRSFDGELYSDIYSVGFLLEYTDEMKQYPTVDITEPDEGAEVDGNFLIQGEAKDDTAVESIFFRFDGGSWRESSEGFEPYTGPAYIKWSLENNEGQFTDGEHLLEVVSLDEDGRNSAIDSVRFIVDHDNGGQTPANLEEMIKDNAPTLIVPEGNEMPNDFADAEKFDPSQSEVFYKVVDYTEIGKQIPEMAAEHPDGFYILEYILIFSESNWRDKVKHDGDGESIKVFVDAKTKEPFLWSSSFHKSDVVVEENPGSYDLEKGSNGPVPSSQKLMAWGFWPVDWSREGEVLTNDDYTLIPLEEATPYPEIGGTVGALLGERAKFPAERDEIKYPYAHHNYGLTWEIVKAQIKDSPKMKPLIEDADNFDGTYNKKYNIHIRELEMILSEEEGIQFFLEGVQTETADFEVAKYCIEKGKANVAGEFRAEDLPFIEGSSMGFHFFDWENETVDIIGYLGDVGKDTEHYMFTSDFLLTRTEWETMTGYSYDESYDNGLNIGGLEWIMLGAGVGTVAAVGTAYALKRRKKISGAIPQNQIPVQPQTQRQQPAVPQQQYPHPATPKKSGAVQQAPVQYQTPAQPQAYYQQPRPAVPQQQYPHPERTLEEQVKTTKPEIKQQKEISLLTEDVSEIKGSDEEHQRIPGFGIADDSAEPKKEKKETEDDDSEDFYNLPGFGRD